MSDIKVIICDDKPEMRDILRRIIERADDYSICALAENGEECVELFRKHAPKVVFLDVEMPGMNGIECARLIQDIDPLAFIIFATAYSEYMDKAFELYAFDYLVKPFRIERVSETLGRIQALARRPASLERLPEIKRTPSGRVLLRKKDAAALVDAREIILIQRENRQTAVYTSQDVFHSADTLAAFEQKLDMSLFFRCHKSYIINLSFIDDITPYGRWTYIARLKGIKSDALITHEKFEELKALFG